MSAAEAIGRLSHTGLTSISHGRYDRAFRLEHGIIEVETDDRIEWGHLLSLWEFVFVGEFRQSTSWDELREIAARVKAEVFFYDPTRKPDPQSLDGEEMWVHVTDQNAPLYFPGHAE